MDVLAPTKTDTLYFVETSAKSRVQQRNHIMIIMLL